jgi:hypothetical protein
MDVFVSGFALSVEIAVVPERRIGASRQKHSVRL